MARLYDYSKWDKIDTDDTSSSDDDDGEVVIQNDWADEDRPPPQTVTNVAALADADDRRPPPPPEPVPNVVHGPEPPPPPPPPPPLPRWEVDDLPATLVECAPCDVAEENVRGELEDLYRGFLWVTAVRGSQRGGFAPPAIRVETGPVAAAGAVAFATRAPDRLPSSKKDAIRLAFAAALPHVRARMAGVPPLEGTKKQKAAARAAATPRTRLELAGAALGWDAPEFEGKTCRWGAPRRESTAPNNREGGDVAQLAALVALRAMEADYGAGVVDHFVRQAQAPPEPVRAPPQDGGVEEAKEEPPPRATAAPAARGAPVGGGSSVLDVAARCCGGDEGAGKGRNKGGRPMSDDELERFRAAVVGLEVAWGADSRGVVEGVERPADELRVQGFGSAGEAPTVAAWWEAVGGGEKFGVKAAATALGSGDGDKLAAELCRRRKLRFPAFPCLAIAGGSRVPLEMAALVDGGAPLDDDDAAAARRAAAAEAAAAADDAAAAETAALAARVVLCLRAGRGRVNLSQFAEALRDRGFAALPAPGTRGRRRQLEGLAAASGGAFAVVADAASACWVELGDGQDYAAPPPIAALPPPAAFAAPAAAPPVPPPPAAFAAPVAPPPPPTAPLPPPAAGAEDWLGDEDEDLGAVPGGALERLRTIGWWDAAFDAAAATHRADEPERILKFHQLLGAERHRAGVEPHDDACACFWVRVDGVGFHNWSKKHKVTMPYDGRVHGAFVAAARRAVADFRRHGLDPLAAFTESDEITFLFRGPATTAGGASDPRRRLETFAASVFTSAFAAALPGEMTDGGNDGFFDARSFAASSNAAGLAALVWRRLDTTRNASSQALRHLHDVKYTPGNHKEQRGRLAGLGTPWASLPPELRYGTLLLADDDRAHNVRLRVPRTADEARALDRAVFDEQRWTDALHGPHPRARV